MKLHRHIPSEEIFEKITSGEPLVGIAGCKPCEAEAASLSRFLSELRRSDAESGATTDWDDLLLRSRIREALAKEKPHVRSIFDRFAILRPAFVSALVASLALAVWSPPSQNGDKEGTKMASMNFTPPGRLPAWTPLPDESDDEGLSVLLEWTPNEDELEIAGCRASCLSGLSKHEEENLLLAVASTLPPPPVTGRSPL